MRSERYGWRFMLILIVAWTVLLYLLLPIFVATPISLSPERYLLMPRGEYSLRHYENLFTNERWLSSIWQSLVIAVASTTIAVITGSLAAVGIWRLASRLGETLRAFVLLPMIVPPIVSALAFFQVFADLGLLDTMLGVILAHTVLAVPYVVITVSTSLAGFDLKLEQAARNLGASMRQTIRYVILPNIMPGVLSGAVFAFILSWDEIVVTLFISKLNVFTLPRRMWDGIREQADPTIAACATTLILITFAAILTYLVLQRRGPKARPQGA
ncbi:MAG: ABC transporter permease [Rhodospirillaceae bacterium]|nr:ABC transporter permease [Rhodospirillaceae bacterium]